LSTFSIIFLVFSLFFTEDGKKMKQDGFFSGWSAGTLIPVTTNALGGIIVGLVTKHAGSVQKGFALIFGLIISGLIQAKAKGVTAEQVVGGILAAISLWMHASYPARMIF
jgi:UDP-sugar transporter A1/2/3